MVIIGSFDDKLGQTGTWFAWRPVFTESGHTVWLERVSYRCEMKHVFGAPPDV